MVGWSASRELEGVHSAHNWDAQASKTAKASGS